MKKLLLAGFAVSALIAPAIAADMPVPAPPVATWTGFYLGVNAGYGLSAGNSVDSVGLPNACSDASTAACVPPPFPIANPPFNPPNTYGLASATAATFSTGTGQNGGFFGGGQFGYNYQLGTSSVIGLEADLQAMTGSGHSTTLVSSTPASGFPASPVNQTATVSTKIDYIGTIRARAGYLWTPDFLLYVTAGLAYGETELSSSITQNVPNQNVPGGPLFTPYTGVGTVSNVQFGGAVGAGLEWMLVRNWSVRAEYLYVGLYNESVTSNLINTDHVNGGSLSSVAVVTTARFKENIARAAINYHF